MPVRTVVFGICLIIFMAIHALVESDGMGGYEAELRECSVSHSCNLRSK